MKIVLFNSLADYLLDAGDSSKALETYDEYLKRRQSDDPKIVDDVKVRKKEERDENIYMYLMEFFIGGLYGSML